MNTALNYLRKNPLLSTISVIFLGIVIIRISHLTSKPIINLLAIKIGLNFYTKNTVFKFFMLLYSIIAILLINKGKLNNYGFCKPYDIEYFRFTLKVIGITFASLLIGSILFIGILSKVFPTGNSTGFPEPSSILQMILTIWIWSSLCEEVLVRGLIQGYIQHLQSIKIFRLSLPVLVSGFFFGSMHLSLLSAGMGAWFVTFIVFNTTVIGLLAAYYREKTGSLIPAFWVHFIANLVGSIPLIIKLLIT